MKLSPLLLAALTRSVRTASAAEVYQVLYPSLETSFGDAVIFSDEPGERRAAAARSRRVLHLDARQRCRRGRVFRR